MGLALKNMGPTPEEFYESFTPREFHLFLLIPKEILNFYNLFPKNSIVPQLGWREVRILNAIAQ